MCGTCCVLVSCWMLLCLFCVELYLYCVCGETPACPSLLPMLVGSFLRHITSNPSRVHCTHQVLRKLAGANCLRRVGWAAASSAIAWQSPRPVVVSVLAAFHCCARKKGVSNQRINFGFRWLEKTKISDLGLHPQLGGHKCTPLQSICFA